MSTVLSDHAGRRPWKVAGLVFAVLLPAFLDFHILAEAPGIRHGLGDGLETAGRLVAAHCGHGRFVHVEATRTVAVKPCPACFLSTVQRWAPACSQSCDGLPPAGVSAPAAVPTGPALALVLWRPRGPPAAS